MMSVETPLGTPKTELTLSAGRERVRRSDITLTARKRVAILAGVVLALAFALPVHASEADNGTGYFWLYDRSDGTGQYAGFSVGPDHSVNFTTQHYTYNCPGGVCSSLNNTVSSIRLSCGSSATAFSTLDKVTFYAGDPYIGGTYGIVRGTRQCVNGSILIAFSSTYTNWAGSMVTHNGG